ncbi:MAG: SRPBCC family protein [Chloroflexi bacterium]|nr:SRPBCC family protein [Chloroflexota bacterium]
MPSIELAKIIDAPVESAWAVIADMEGYADITADGVSKVEVLEGEGEGMLRRCYNQRGESWTETCPVWEEGHQFRFVVHTDAPDYPYPLSHVEGLWSVEATPQGTLIKARFDYAMKNKLFGWLLAWLARGNAISDTQYLLDQWEAKALAMAE